MNKLVRDIEKIALDIDPEIYPLFESEEQSITLHKTPEQTDSGVVLYLPNLFAQARTLSRADRKRNIRDLLEAALLENSMSSEDWMASLRFRVRTPVEIEQRNFYAVSQGRDQDITVTYGDEQILLELVSDGNALVGIVNESQLQDHDITREQAFKMARAALVRSTTGVQWEQLTDDIWISIYGDDYDFARLVASPDQLNCPFDDSTPIVYAPSHAICLLSSRHDEAALNLMVEVGTQLADGHRPFSNLFWTLADNGIWIEYTGDCDSGNHAVIELQQIKDQAANYDDQKTILETLLKRQDEHSHVAEFMAYRDSHGHIHSTCSYTLNCPSYLPKTDLVQLFEYGAEKSQPWGELSWSAFESILCADTLVKMPEHLPFLYELKNLSAEQEAALKLASRQR